LPPLVHTPFRFRAHRFSAEDAETAAKILRHKDLYDVLGVTRTAVEKDLVKAYRKVRRSCIVCLCACAL